MEKRCDRCEYLGRDVIREDAAECRRLPPAIKNGLREWPRTGGADWCGEWHQQEKEQKG